MTTNNNKYETCGPLEPYENSPIPELIGRRVTKAEHFTSKVSDSDEVIILTFDDGSILRVGTSEWLNWKLTDKV